MVDGQLRSKPLPLPVLPFPNFPSFVLPFVSCLRAFSYAFSVVFDPVPIVSTSLTPSHQSATNAEVRRSSSKTGLNASAVCNQTS